MRIVDLRSDTVTMPALKDAAGHERCRKKMLGGGMRQTGILATCGIISLEEMTDRLSEDHDNARYLANGLAGIEGFNIKLQTVQTNIVCFRFELTRLSCRKFVENVSKKGVYMALFCLRKIMEE